MTANHLDRTASRHVEHTATVGPFHLYGIHEPVALNDNVPVATQPAPSLTEFRRAPGFIYLGSPYSLYSDGHDEAARIVSEAAASLMASGMSVYSPIAHGHFVSAHGDLPQTWTFWKEQCQPMIDAAGSLIVLMMDGWRESVGLNYEIDEFARARKPILYLHPQWGEVRRVA